MRKILRAYGVLMAIALLSMAGSGCSSKARHLAKGKEYFEAGDYPKAEAEYLSVVRTDRGNVEAFTRLGIIFKEDGRVRNAIQALVRARELAPNDSLVRIKLGEAYASVGLLREARTNALFVLDQKPDEPAAVLLLADTATSLDDVEALIQRLQKLPVPAEKQAGIQVALGKLYFHLHDYKAANDAFEKARALAPKMPELSAGFAALYWMQKDIKSADQALKTAVELSPTRSPFVLRYAQFKIQTGDTAGAKSFVEGVVKKAPDYLPAWLMLGEIAAVGKKFDEANVAVDKALAIDPANFEALLLSGRVSLAQADMAGAIGKFEKLTKYYQTSPPAHFQLGVAYEANNDLAKAISSYSQAITLNPGYSDAMLALARARLNHGDVDDAMNLLQRLVKQQPKDGQSQMLLAQAYVQKGNLEDALKVYRQLEETNPDNAVLALREGSILILLKKNDQARKALERSLQLGPENPAPLEQLTALDLDDKQYEKAAQRLQQQLKRDPKSQMSLLLMAKVRVAQGDKNQAMEILSKAIEEQPDFKEGAVLLSQIYEDAGQYQKALDGLQKILVKSPADKAALMRLGMLQSDMKNYPAARDAYEKLLADDPKFGPALNNLAFLYSEKLNQLDKAYDLARRARDLTPPDPSIAQYTADTLGWILFKKGDYARAVSLLQESVKQFPGDPEVQYHLGMADYMSGNESESRSALQAAAQSNKDFPGKAGMVTNLAILAIDVNRAGPEARGILEKRLAEQPGDPIALSRLGGIYKRDGNADKAIETYEAALKANPKDAGAMANLAELYSPRPGQSDKAFNLAKAAYKLAPGDDRVARILGRQAFLNGDYRWSLSLLEGAARNGTPDPELFYDLGEAAYSRGKVADAETDMKSALQAGTNFLHGAEARQFMDMVALSANPAQAAAASAQVEQIVKLQPNYVPALMAMAVAQEQKGDLGGATQSYEKALASYPDFTPAKARLAIIYSTHPGDDKRAYTLALAAREALPNDLDVATALGILTYRQGEYARAERALKEIAGQRSDDPRVMYYLGMSQFQLKKNADGKKNLQRAIDLKLPDELAGEARRALAQIK